MCFAGLRLCVSGLGIMVLGPMKMDIGSAL